MKSQMQQLNVRMAPDLAKRAKVAAASEGISLQKWIARAIETACNASSDAQPNA